VRKGTLPPALSSRSTSQRGTEPHIRENAENRF
jgi:hypothetical protein